MRTLLRRPLLIGALLAAIAAPAVAQDAPYRPPAKPAPPQTSAAHMALIKEGVALHDAGDFDGAIAKYQSVLADSPEDLLAMYETAFALSSKQEYAKALEIARQGVEYQSPRIGEFYSMIGNIYLLMKQPEQAIEALEYGIGLQPMRAQLHFNLSVSYANANRAEDAIRSVKTAASIDPAYPSPHQNLAGLFLTQGYPVPALLAAARALTLDQRTPRAGGAMSVLFAVLRESPEQTRGGGPPSPVPSVRREEGDFRAAEELIYAGRPPRTPQQVQETPEIRYLVGQIEALIDAIVAQNPSASSFTLQYYVPYFAELKAQGMIEPFVYYIFQRTSMPGVSEWLGANQPAVQSFLTWSSGFEWARPALP